MAHMVNVMIDGRRPSISVGAQWPRWSPHWHIIKVRNKCLTFFVPSARRRTINQFVLITARLMWNSRFRITFTVEWAQMRNSTNCCQKRCRPDNKQSLDVFEQLLLRARTIVFCAQFAQVRVVRPQPPTQYDKAAQPAPGHSSVVLASAHSLLDSFVLVQHCYRRGERLPGPGRDKRRVNQTCSRR